MPYKGETYPGQHVAIIDDKTWCAVQERLIGNGANRRYATNAKAESLLTGMVFDETGERLSPSHARKKGRHHRYYISRRLMHGADRRDDGWRLPPQELERAVIAPIQGLLRDPWRLIDLLQIGDQKPATVTRIRQWAEALAAELQGNDSTRRRIILRELIDRIDLSASSLVIGLNRPGLGRALEIDMPSDKGGQGNIVRITAPIALRRRGVESKLVLAGHDKAPDVPDPQLCRLIAQARLWFDELAFGNATSVRAIARREGVDESDVSRILPLAFLAPDIVEAILAGRQAVELTAESLKRLRSLPADWAAQRRVLGFTG